jgi:gamma-glutamyltranspeptidase/glutathione hydrolase
MLVHRARDRSTRVLDFFTSVPGLGVAEPRGATMETVAVDFSGGSVQEFRIGGASCAVPGAALGMEEAQRAYGRLPVRELARPAVELARAGFPLSRGQAYLHEILDLILRARDEGRAIYGPKTRLHEGDPVVMRELADTIELLAESGARELYRGDLGSALVRHVRECGGSITDEDLAAYRVVRRRPVVAQFRGNAFESNPPPSSGGLLIAYGLRLLEALGLHGRPGSADAIDALARVMREQARARVAVARDLYRGGVARRLLSDESVVAALARVGQAPSEVAQRGTTHISAVDEEGNAAALTVSTGAGSGVIVPGTGIHMNNMLGEFDLWQPSAPGARMSSGTAPTVVLENERPRLVVGSAGSLRLRGAIMQIVVNVVEHGMDVHDAIEAPRVHLEGDELHCEGGVDASEMDALAARGYDVQRWTARNLFFGGAAAVAVSQQGELTAAGDPRRGGAGVVVA